MFKFDLGLQHNQGRGKRKKKIERGIVVENVMKKVPFQLTPSPGERRTLEEGKD